MMMMTLMTTVTIISIDALTPNTSNQAHHMYPFLMNESKSRQDSTGVVSVAQITNHVHDLCPPEYNSNSIKTNARILSITTISIRYNCNFVFGNFTFLLFRSNAPHDHVSPRFSNTICTLHNETHLKTHTAFENNS